MKVLISDNLSPRGVEILKKAGFDVDFRSKTPAEEIEQIIGDFDALIIRSATKVTAALLEKATGSRSSAAPAAASTMSTSPRRPRRASSSPTLRRVTPLPPPSTPSA